MLLDLHVVPVTELPGEVFDASVDDGGVVPGVAGRVEDSVAVVRAEDAVDRVVGVRPSYDSVGRLE